jgi:hypothetical protein
MKSLYYGHFFIWNLYLILLKLKHNLVNLEQQRECAFCQNIPNIMAGEPVWEIGLPMKIATLRNLPVLSRVAFN